MGRFLVFLMIFFLVQCGEKNETNAILYVSNHSTDNFEKTFFKIYVNGDIVFRDTLQNERLSFHWTEKEILVPKERFELKAIVSGDDYRLERDTIIGYDDSLQVFVRFNFYPFYKRYNNPDIYKYIDGEVNDFQSFADSLYANDILDNAGGYLNDTIPDESSLEIYLK